MKPIYGVAFGLLCLTFVARSETGTVQGARFVAVKGKVRIDGTSSIDAWQVESRALNGHLETTQPFPPPGSPARAQRAIEVQGEVSIEVRSLKSVEKDGKPFSTKMDGIMYDALRAGENPKIVFRPRRLVLRTDSKMPNAPEEWDTHGSLRIAGVERDVDLRLNSTWTAENQLRFWGSTTLKMSEFRIDPPSPTIALGLIKTDDEVRVSFEWVLVRRK